MVRTGITEIEISPEQCSGCGMCVEICPDGAIELRDRKAVMLHDGCFLCGHCRAVCPEEAVRIPSMPNELQLSSGPITLEEKGTRVSPRALADLMVRRRSCRRYLDRPVAMDLLQDLVTLAITAPSGTNCQQWGFLLLPTRDDVLVLAGGVGEYYRGLNNLADKPLLSSALKLFGKPGLADYRKRYRDSVAEALDAWDEKGIDRLFHGATAAMLVTGDRSASCSMEDSLLATQNILLAAESMGLGSCLIGFVVEAVRRDRSLQQLLDLQQDEELHSVIGLGYPAVAWRRFSGRKAAVPRVLNLAKRRN